MSASGFEDRYARYLAGEMDDEERRAFEREVAADPELSEEVYADQGVQAALQRGEVVRMRTPWWRWAAPLAAAAIILLAINLREPPVTEPVMRGGTNGIELVAPVGEVASVPTQFEWAPVEGATRYRFELMDAEARIIRRAMLPGTVAMFPTGVPERGAWRVVALNELGEAVAVSAPVRFQVTPAN